MCTVKLQAALFAAIIVKVCTKPLHRSPSDFELPSFVTSSVFEGTYAEER